MTRAPRLASALAAVALTASVLPVLAASSGGMSDAFKGFGANGKDPIQIEADSLEVLDKDRNAVFTGNVHVLQKDTVLKTQRLRVFYEGNGASDLAKGDAAGAQAIRRFEAEGKVLISQKDQTVTGDRGWFDMHTQTAQITGGVVLTQGKNVARGERLSIDLKSGQYKLDGTGRVQLILESQKPAGQ